MAEIMKTRREYISENFFPKNIGDPNVAKAFTDNRIKDIEVFYKFLDDEMCVVKPQEELITKEKMIFQKFLYDKFYKVHGQKLSTYGDTYFSPEVPYFDSALFGVPYFIPIELFGENLDIHPREIIRDEGRHTGIKKFAGTYPLVFGSLFDYFICLLNTDEKMFEEFMEILDGFKSRCFVVIRAYFFQKKLARQFKKELDEHKVNSKVIKI